MEVKNIGRHLNFEATSSSDLKLYDIILYHTSEDCFLQSNSFIIRFFLIIFTFNISQCILNGFYCDNTIFMFYLDLHFLFDLLVCQFSQQFKDGMLIGLNMTNIMSRYRGSVYHSLIIRYYISLRK